MSEIKLSDSKSSDIQLSDIKNLALTLTELAFDKKAFNVKLLHVTELVGYCDYFVVASGRSDRQVSAIGDHILATMKKEHGRIPVGSEGVEHGQWVLIDYGDVVVHVFNAPVREFYDLDGLWQEAERVEIRTPEWEDEMRESVFEQGVIFQP